MNTERIVKLAKAQGKTLTYLCTLIGKPKWYLKDVRTKNINIPYEYLLIIANDLGTSPEYLTFETDDDGSGGLYEKGLPYGPIVCNRGSSLVIKQCSTQQLKKYEILMEAIKELEQGS
ncbi:MAG: helix-turn-helix transcriptional regulator [Clostridia bacterium]|nr:helix-turn-helix transcriptional regulator [Clostridia bacterium]